MTKKTWKARITKACKDAGTYKPYFDIEIDLLARTLENRDKAQEAYENSGSEPVVNQPYSSGKGSRIKKNPILEVIDNLNKDAKEYMKDLGLTPQSLNKINGDALKGAKKKSSSLGEILKNSGI